MGGAVSAGRDNNDLVDNLVESNYIKTDLVERVFRAVDRADYFLPASKRSAYKDIAWKCGSFHLSAPCIYSDVMEWLKLKSGLSFLNLGSGTGYLSTMAGLILGTNGINHGVEINSTVVNYAIDRLEDFLQNSAAIDEFDFCHPKFVIGNCLCLSPSVQQYDRVYCGAACPKKFGSYLKNLIKVGGILVMPVDDKLLQIKRISEREWATKNIQCVSFGTLVTPSPEEANQIVPTSEVAPASLQILCRTTIRNVLRNIIYEEDPSLRNVPLKSKKVRAKNARKISLPIDEESDPDDFGLFHNLDRENGSREMNALLNLVLSMENDVLSPDYDSAADDPDEPYEDYDELDNPPEDRDDDDNPSDHSLEDGSTSSSSASDTHIEQISNSNSVVQNLSILDTANVKSENKPNTLVSGTDMPSSSKSCSVQNKDESNTSKSNQPSDIVKKRIKLDSGIGVDDEGQSLGDNTSSSPDTTTGSEKMDYNSSEEYLGDNEQRSPLDKQDGGNKSRKVRRQRKRRYTYDEADADGEEGDSSEADENSSSPTQTAKVKKMKRKSSATPNPCDVQRNLLSKRLKCKVRQLPLPMPLKIFVNMNREFDQ